MVQYVGHHCGEGETNTLSCADVFGDRHVDVPTRESPKDAKAVAALVNSQNEPTELAVGGRWIAEHVEPLRRRAGSALRRCRRANCSGWRRLEVVERVAAVEATVGE